MRKIFLASLLCALITTGLKAQTILHPVIKDYGAIADVPFAVDRPDPNMEYKIVIESGEKLEKPAEVYPPLDHVARLYNLHVYGGVPQKNLDVAFVIYGFPISIVLNNEAYHKKFGVDNPNIKLIQELKAAGVKLFACGQSILKHEVDPNTVNPDFIISISRFTTVSTYQMKGYAFFKY